MAYSSRVKRAEPAKQLSRKERRAIVNQRHYHKNGDHIRKQKREYMRQKRAKARGLVQVDEDRISGAARGQQPTADEGVVDSDQELDQQLEAFKNYEDVAALEEEIELLEAKLAKASDLAANRSLYIMELEARNIELEKQATDVVACKKLYEEVLDMRDIETGRLRARIRELEDAALERMYGRADQVADYM